MNGKKNTDNLKSRIRESLSNPMAKESSSMPASII